MSSISFIVFDSDGTILRTGACPRNQMSLQLFDETEFIMEGKANGLTQFIDFNTKGVREKYETLPGEIKTTILADSKDLCIFEGLPIPCNIEIFCSSLNIFHAFTNREGRLEFGASTPGAYFIRITALHHKPFGITINAIHSDTRD
jgi:hypothetical protein